VATVNFFVYFSIQQPTQKYVGLPLQVSHKRTVKCTSNQFAGFQ